MKKIIVTAALALLAGAANATCHLKSEQISGMNKICLYTCTAGDKAITVRDVAMCPMSIGQASKTDYFAGVAKPLLLAHSGGTDKNGCHVDSKTGYRHCH